MAVSAGRTNIGNRVHQTIVTPVAPVMSPLSPRRTHMAVSACCNDGTEENASNTCGLAVSACCLQLSNTWLCQPVAQTWLCQPAVSMVNATYQHMLRLAVSAGCTNMAVSAGRIDVTCSGANTCGLAVSACGTHHLMFFLPHMHVKP